LKSTYGSGRNLICTNKNELDYEEANKKMRKWLSYQFLNTTTQMHYSQKTNVILCEKFIETEKGTIPNDYKFYCFNGEPKIILAFEDRDSKTLKKMFYDLDWNALKQYCNYENIDVKIQKPPQLEKMIEYARKLRSDFPFVRVDFYNVEDEIIFGELTFTPAAC